eukprot:CAMPEP_0198224558 /NCGR_PEP_ID=MMETSP1445-20131203/97419_1 /TAXON_ID=36898 /ORGANISM="Pyramimonas sp., Strain CCMP2087" /LENGTH=107 /DNA_ID=CAMNT_0043903779 /DNA_START=197 /DNA_END=520 /DNA_ORIENTATION=+
MSRPNTLSSPHATVLHLFRRSMISSAGREALSLRLVKELSEASARIPSYVNARQHFCRLSAVRFVRDAKAAMFLQSPKFQQLLTRSRERSPLHPANNPTPASDIARQ